MKSPTTLEHLELPEQEGLDHQGVLPELKNDTSCDDCDINFIDSSPCHRDRTSPDIVTARSQRDFSSVDGPPHRHARGMESNEPDIIYDV